MVEMDIGISDHAIRRYIERVNPAAGRAAAVAAIRDIARTGRSRPRPRWWTSRRGESARTRYVYSARHAGVCLVVSGGCVATVMSRRVCREWSRRERGDG